MADIYIHLSNGDFIATSMYEEVPSLPDRMHLIEDAINDRKLIKGMYTTTLGAMRNANILISKKKVVVITSANGKETNE